MQSRHLFSKTEFGLDKRRNPVYNSKQMFLYLKQREHRKINFCVDIKIINPNPSLIRKKFGFINNGDPYGNRTHVTAVKGRCLNRLTNGPGSGNLIRTDDIPGMNRLLYQLSYAAMWSNDLGTAETSFLIISMRPLFVKKFFRIFLFSWAFPRKNPAKAPPSPDGPSHCPLFAVEEQGQHPRAHVGAGEGLVGSDDELLRLGHGADHVRQGLGVLRAVAVGDGHPLVFRVLHPAAVFLHDGGHGLFAAPVLAAGGDVPGGVAPQHGLDVQHRADHGRGPGDPAGALEEVQIVHGEELQRVLGVGIHDVRRLRRGLPCRPQVGGLAGHQPGAEAGAQGVHHPHGALREFLQQLLGRHPGRLAGAADAGGHGEIHRVLPPLQHRPEGIQEQLGVQQTGLHPAPLAEHFVVAVGVEAVQAPVIGAGHAVHGIGAGQDLDPQLPQQPPGQVGASVHKDGKRHGYFLLWQTAPQAVIFVFYYKFAPPKCK